MNVFFLGNNRVGLEVLRCLKARGEQICGLTIHPPERARFAEEIRQVAAITEDRVFEGSTLRRPKVLEQIAALKPDIGVSAYFGYILRQEFLDLFPRGVINLHPSYLPFNRGANPNIWSIVDGTPAGVTIHEISSGVDTGPILAQTRVPVDPMDTGESLYRKLEAAAIDLFGESWDDLCAGHLKPVTQDPRAGTHHKLADTEGIDEIDLDRTFTAQELIDLLRARTFPPYDGAYFITEEGRKIYLRLELYEKGEDAK